MTGESNLPHHPEALAFAVIADDLTGAADAVAPFAAGVYRTVVRLRGGTRLTGASNAANVIAWNTGNRDAHRRSVLERAAAVQSAAAEAIELRPHILFLKIDSTLRGFPALELDGLLTAMPGRMAVVTPAFPAHGRLVRGGVLVVRGDDRGPVRGRFAARPNELWSHIDLDAVRRCGAELPDRLRAHHKLGARGVIVDAETDSDLDTLAAAILAAPELLAPVGSAGLSGAIARRLCAPRETTSGAAGLTTGLRPASRVDPAVDLFRNGRVLVAVGSRNPISQAQAAALSGSIEVSRVALDRTPDRQRLAPRMLSAFASGARCVLAAAPIEEATPGPAALLRVERGLLARVYRDVPDLALIATGGEAAAALLGAVGDAEEIEITGEFEPGVVAGQVATGRLAGLPLMVKAGGFGDESLLLRCLGLM